MMLDTTQPPLGATLGLMGWPWPGDGGTMWRDGAIAQGMEPTPDNLNEMRWRVQTNLRERFPKTAPWADSMEWLQERGRGDLVGVLDLRSGAVVMHTCVAWREDYRDEAGLLLNWQWVVCSVEPHTGLLLETYADASAALLDRKGRHTQKALARPTLSAEEARAAMEEWHRTVAPLLKGKPPVATWAVEQAPFNEEAYAAECRAILDTP